MIGIDPKTLAPIAPVIPPDIDARFRRDHADWIEDHYGAEYFEWPTHWHHAPYERLAKTFTRDELVLLWHSCIFSSKLDDHLEEHEPVLWKVRHSLWRYGADTKLPRLVAYYNRLSRIAVGLPDFDVRLSWTRSINTAAWAEHGRDNPIYLDASFGILLHYKGRHVMTISFATSVYGILVAQVQLREKRGNRFLYKLPMSYLDFALDMLHRAFPDETLYLVTGASTAVAVRAAYTKNPERLTPETAARIERFYDQPLGRYMRTGETVRCGSDDGRVFAKLARDAAHVSHEAAA